MIKYHTIITCINFSDYLKFVYEYNKPVINNLTILSSYTDTLTENFCLKNNIFLYQTDTFFKNNNPINRSAATNEFLLNHTSRLQNDEWILFTDADIIFDEPIHRIEQLINQNLLNDRSMVSCPRKIYRDINDYPNGHYTIENIGFFGYFQFFHKNLIMSDINKNVAPLPEHSDVSQHDIKFVNKYKTEKIYLSDCYAVHCGDIGIHWKGRKYNA